MYREQYREYAYWTAKNIWKSYIWTANKDMNESDPHSNVDYLSSTENKAWKKIQACTGFEPMTSAIPVQRSTNWANKPTGSWSLCWFQINPWSDHHLTALFGTNIVHINVRITFIQIWILLTFGC